MDGLDADGCDAQACIVLKIVPSNQVCAVCQRRRADVVRREENGEDEGDEDDR